MKQLLETSTTALKERLAQYPWLDRRAYGEWLAQTYYYVRHSTRLLAAAAARFPIGEHGDALHYRFAKHMAEEKKHERLAIRDLMQLGLSIDAFAERHTTRMFYEPQYYKIEHQSPAVLFGYILPLEAIGPAYGREVIACVTREFGPKCASFLTVHTEEDEDHIVKALRLVEAIPEEQRVLVAQNIAQTTQAYCLMLDDMARPSS